MKHFLQANIQLLSQAKELLGKMENEHYSHPEPMFYHSSIGGHLRHCLDHYESFNRGVQEGKIDYDDRDRDPAEENNTQAAISRIDRIISKLNEWSESELDNFDAKVLLVKMDCGVCQSEQKQPEQWQKSSVGRELQFLISHTVHHYAIIRGIYLLSGGELSTDFGMAPSTLRYKSKLARAQ